MNIMYTCDNNYVWIMGISLISLFENNKDIKEINVYLLGENVDLDNKKKIEDIALRYDRDVLIIDVPKLDLPEGLMSDRWPRSAFTRLYSASLLPLNVNQVLYLDCDIIVKSNLISIYNYVSNEKTVWGVKDCIGEIYKTNIGLTKDENYINAGVLFLNIDRLRQIDIASRIDSYLNEYKKYINYADQDVLNGIFKNDIGIIPPQFNVMTIDVMYSFQEIITLRKPMNFYEENEFENAVLNPIIIHYTTNMTVVRPWFSNTNHPFAKDFSDYQAKSCWKKKILPKMVFKGKEYKIIQLIEIMPRRIALKLLGLLHSTIKPIFIRIKNLI